MRPNRHIFCAACGARVGATHNFCISCGDKLQAQRETVGLADATVEPQLIGARLSTSELGAQEVGSEASVVTPIVPSRRIFRLTRNTPRDLIRRYPMVGLAFFAPLFPLLVGLTVGGSLESTYTAPYYVGFGSVVLMAVAALLYLHRETVVPILCATPMRLSTIDWRWGLVLVAVLARYVLLEYVPPDWPSFEVVQQGRHAYDIVTLGIEVPIHHTFSFALGTIGWVIFGPGIESVRWGFEVAAAVSIVLMAVCLRRLNVGWAATLVAVFILATLRWSVIIGGYAEETFSGTLLVTLQLLFIVLADTSRRSQLLYAGLAGIVSGILFYEYVPWVMMTPLPIAYWFVRGVFAKRHSVRRNMLKMGLWFVVSFTLITAPLMSVIIYEPLRSGVGDTMMRHEIVERNLDGTIDSYYRTWLDDSLTYLKVIVGQFETKSSALFRAGNDSVIPPIVGVIFFAGIAGSLVRPGVLLPFFLAVAILGFIVLIAVPSDRYYLGRLAPAMPMITLLAGIILGQIFHYVQQLNIFGNWIPKHASIAGILCVVITAIIVGVNFRDSMQMSNDKQSLIEYTNNKYPLCYPIGMQPYSFDQVIVVANEPCGFEDERWLYRTLDFEIEWREEFPNPSEILPGTLVLAGHRHGISEESKQQIVELAYTSSSSDSLLEFETLLQRTGVVTFCRECQPLADR